MAEQNEKKPTIPYVPFRTFLNTLDSLAAFFPHKIDTSIWMSYSGGIRSQLLSTFKFFGLIDDAGVPTAELRSLVENRDNRPTLLREAMKRGYGDLMKLDLSKATPNSFDAEMRKFGQDGDTHRKAVSFFLAAAKFAKVPLSPLIVKRGGMTGTRPKRKNGTKKEMSAETIIQDGQNRNTQAVGSSKTVLLPGGTTVTISTDRDAFQMNAEDRKIIFDLIESLEESEAAQDTEEEDARDED